MPNLIPIEEINAVEVFNNEGTIRALLSEIEKQALDFHSDVSTKDGRAVIASQAYKVSRSKSVIDEAGKQLTEEWARKKKIVDASRKLARDFCDELRDRIRKPLTDFEAEEARRAVLAAEKAEMEAAELEAYAEDALFERERKVRDYEARIAAEEAEKARIVAAQAAAQEREEFEAKVRMEAVAKAEQAAAEAVRRAQAAAQKAEQDRIAAAEKAKRDRIAAAEKAEREKAEAIEHERREAEYRDRERLRLEEAKKNAERVRIAEADRIERERITNREHRRAINAAIVDTLVENHIGQRTAIAIVKLVASGAVPAMSIRY